MKIITVHAGQELAGKAKAAGWCIETRQQNRCERLGKPITAFQPYVDAPRCTLVYVCLRVATCVDLHLRPATCVWVSGWGKGWG
jgi:hypothetical protein